MGMFRETLAEGEEGSLHLGPERPRVYSDLSPKDKERETLAEGEEGSLHLGPERPRVYSDLSPKDKERGLRDSNYDHLYTYLKQHEAHANENKMMLDRFTQHAVDPLALMSNVSHQQYYLQSYTTSPSTHENGLVLDEEQLVFIAGGQDKVVDEDVDEQPVQDLVPSPHIEKSHFTSKNPLSRHIDECVRMGVASLKVVFLSSFFLK
uniref:Integrase, catalytic region, zinc finger, CCHC-type, peptidase aspartic, catalytic n=1 Tax=Tanacetum cinerariifolium TaxID=118510 RepID=A0A6L2JYC5_TANCI|nr:hypothetical protein [Tanacetum cinerariifolium]